jgi:putative MATE family efflux protein
MSSQSISASAESPAGWLADVRAALRGAQQDYTSGSLNRAIFLLAIPMVLEMAMESLFAVADVFFVAGLGADAVAAVGLTESLLTMVYAIAMGLSMGTTALVARRTGEKNAGGAALAATQSILAGAAMALVIGVAGAAFAPVLLRLMGASDAVAKIGSSYTAWALGSSVTVFQLFLINAIFRGAGDAAAAMRVLWLANGINIILDPCLIYGIGPLPELGVTGAAVATTIGRSTGVAYQLILLKRGSGHIRLSRRFLRLDRTVMSSLLRISLPGMLQFFIAVASWIGLVRIIALFGSSALAGYTIAIRIVIFSVLPAWGLANAAATLVGQNLGAGKPERAERSAWLTGFYNMIFLGILGLLFLLFARPLVSIFTAETAVVETGKRCLEVVSYGYLFYAYGMVMVQAINGAGDTWTPTLINFFCYWVWEIPLGYLLALPFGLGPDGVFLSITIAECTLAIVAVIVFRRGRWKHKQV